MPPIPPTTRNLMIVCVVAMLLQSLLPGVTAYFALWPLNSGLFMPWQPVTYAVLHGNLPHLLFNMLGLWMFGSELDRLWGQKRYLTFALACAVSAALAQLLVTALIGSRAPTVGISGVLFGLLMAYALSFPHRRFDLVGLLPVLLMSLQIEFLSILAMILFVLLLTNRQMVPIPPIPIPALTMVAIFGVIELWQGLRFGSGIAHFAHLGGMLGGWLMMRWWRQQGRGGSRRR